MKMPKQHTLKSKVVQLFFHFMLYKIMTKCCKNCNRCQLNYPEKPAAPPCSLLSPCSIYSPCSDNITFPIYLKTDLTFVFWLTPWPITAGPYYLTHPVNFPCGGKPEDTEETRDLRKSVDFYSFHMRSGLDHIEKTPEWRTIFLLQHDMPEKMLQQGLNGVLEDCVSLVGVDLNASGVYALK